MNDKWILNHTETCTDYTPNGIDLLIGFIVSGTKRKKLRRIVIYTQHMYMAFESVPNKH